MNEPTTITRSYQITVNGFRTPVTEKEWERVLKLTQRRREAGDRLLAYIAHLQRRKMRRRKGERA